jgi:hypothetical protein
MSSLEKMTFFDFNTFVILSIIFIILCNKHWSRIKIALSVLSTSIRTYRDMKGIDNLQVFGDYAVITYYHRGKEYKLYTSYKITSDVSNSIVLLTTNDNRVLNITNPPGLPYTVSANMMKGKKITVKNWMNETSTDFEGDLLPVLSRKRE